MSGPVTYTAVLPIGESTVARLAQLLDAILVLRWFCDAPRIAQLAIDNHIISSTAYRYLHEGIDVLAASAPGVHGALLAARAAGHTHVGLDGTVIRTDRSHTPGPTAINGRAVDLWRSGKHRHHGGNIQGADRPGRVAAVGLGRAPGPRVRPDLRTGACRTARRPRSMARRRPRRAG